MSMFSDRSLLAVVVLATMAISPPVRAQDAGMDASTDAGADAAMDVGADMAMDSGADVAMDVGPDMPKFDDADVATDMALSDAAVGLTFSGTVTLQGRDTYRDCLVRLEATDGEAVRQAYTDDDGAFAIAGLAAGQYDVSVRHPEYDNFEETITLDADTVRDYRLFLSGSVNVHVDVGFAGDPASAVHLVLESERGAVDEDLSVESGTASFDTELGVASWTLTAEADGYQSGHYTFEVPRVESDMPAPMSISLVLHESKAPEVFVNSACACDVEGRPADSVWALLLLAVAGAALWFERRRMA